MDASLAAVRSHAGMEGREGGSLGVGGGGGVGGGVSAWWHSICFDGLNQYPEMHAEALHSQKQVLG